MSAKDLFEESKNEKSKGPLEAVRDAVQAVAPGLSLGKIWNDVKAEAVQQVAAGAHELAAALFNNSGFVMYPRQSSRDDHGVHGPEVQAPETPNIEHENDRGGRGR